MNNAQDTTLLLDNQLCFALYAASRRVIQLYTPMLAEMDVTYTQYITLLVLWEKDVHSIKELGQALMLDTGTLTPMLKKMETKGLITRQRSAEDERIVNIQLTPSGTNLRAIAKRHLNTLYCSSNLDPAILAGLRDQIREFNAQLEQCKD